MHSAGRAATKAEMRRFMDMTELGCLACWIEHMRPNPGDVHHLLRGGRRIGHSATVCLCPYHHRGLFDGTGPSLARSPRAFRERYGGDADLLELQNDMLASDEPARAVVAYRRRIAWSATDAA